MMKKVVVTGATSFIGVPLIYQLLEKKYYVYAVVRPSSKNLSRLPTHKNLKVIELDLKEIDCLPRIIESADVFYHLAWEGTRKPYRDDELLQQDNFKAAVSAMDAAVALHSKVFVGTGSQAEYGKMTGKVDEMYFCHPNTEYGKAKYQAYLRLSDTAKKRGIRFIWGRIFSAYGKYDFSGSLVMSCIDKMQKDVSVQLTECIQDWDYIYVKDVAEALVLFSESECGSGAYNIASGDGHMLKYYVEQLRSILNSKSIVEYGAIPYGEDGPIGFVPVVDKIKNALSWEAVTPFREGILDLLSMQNEDLAYEKN